MFWSQPGFSLTPGLSNLLYGIFLLSWYFISSFLRFTFSPSYVASHTCRFHFPQLPHTFAIMGVLYHTCNIPDYTISLICNLFLVIL